METALPSAPSETTVTTIDTVATGLDTTATVDEAPEARPAAQQPTHIKLGVLEKRDVRRAQLDRYATDERRNQVSSFLAKSLANVWSKYLYEAPRHETTHVVKSPARAVGRFALKGVGVMKGSVESTEFGQSRKRKKQERVLGELQRSLNGKMPDIYINKLLSDLNSLSSDIEYSLVADGNKRKLSARQRS